MLKSTRISQPIHLMQCSVLRHEIIANRLIQSSTQAGRSIEQTSCGFNCYYAIAIPLNGETDQFHVHFIIETAFRDAHPHNANSRNRQGHVIFGENNAFICKKKLNSKSRSQGAQLNFHSLEFSNEYFELASKMSIACEHGCNDPLAHDRN